MIISTESLFLGNKKYYSLLICPAILLCVIGVVQNGRLESNISRHAMKFSSISKFTCHSTLSICTHGIHVFFIVASFTVFKSLVAKTKKSA